MAGKFHYFRMRSAFFLLLLLFLSPFSFASILSDASQHNIERAPALWHYSQNLGNASENIPTMSDPVIFFQAKIFCAIPQVGGRIGAGEETSVLVGWGQAHAQEISESIPNANCPPTTITIEAQPAYAELTTVFSFFGENRSVLVSSPLVDVPFSQGELERELVQKEGNETIENEMAVSLYGTINFPYEKTTQGYEYECTQACPNCSISCSCEYFEGAERIAFVRDVYDTASFEVEGTAARFFVSKPALLKNTKGRNPAEVLVFSRAEMQRAEMTLDGEALVDEEMHGFYSWEDAFGVVHVEKGNANNETAGVLHENAFVLGAGMMEENLSFSHLYKISSAVYFERGAHWLNVSLISDFFRQENFSAEISTKEKTAVVLEEGGSASVFGMEGQAISIQPEIASGEHSFSAEFEGSEEYLPSARVNANAGLLEIGMENAGVLAVLLALFLGMFVALRARGK